MALDATTRVGWTVDGGRWTINDRWNPEGIRIEKSKSSKSSNENTMASGLCGLPLHCVC
jgi:hypothetical protein